MRRSGTRSPTIIDVAAAAGVSKSVVSRALLGQDEVSEATRARVQATAKRLGYLPNAMASGLVRARTSTIGVVLRDLTRPFYGELLVGMLDEAQRSGYKIVTVTSAEDLDVAHAVRALRHLVSMQVDGLVVASARLPSEDIVPLVERVPIVIAGRRESEGRVTSVFSDDLHGGRAMARRVLEVGHRRAAVVLVDQSYSLSQHTRGQAMIDELRAAGACVEVWATPRDGEADAVVADRLGSADVTAVMSPTDAVALDVLEALRLRGCSVPVDMSVTGYDGIGPLAAPFLGLTTFRVPVREMGRTAIELLVDRLEERSDGDRFVALQGEVVPGRTLAAPA